MLEIETVLMLHPSVELAVCFGVPDSKYGEVVHAAVILKKHVEKGEILDFCKMHIAAFKIPKSIHFVDSFPKTATGKIQRSQVAATVIGHAQ